MTLSEHASSHFIASDGRSTSTHAHLVQTFRRSDHIFVIAVFKVGGRVVRQNAPRLSAILHRVVETNAPSVKIVRILTKSRVLAHLVVQ